MFSMYQRQKKELHRCFKLLTLYKTVSLWSQALESMIKCDACDFGNGQNTKTQMDLLFMTGLVPHFEAFTCVILSWENPFPHCR